MINFETLNLPNLILIFRSLEITLLFFAISVPIHKVDDITHINFTDRDHLWFEPNNGGSGGGCKNSNSGSSSSNNNNDRDRNEDPMAAMLENNAKNPKVGTVQTAYKVHG